MLYTKNQAPVHWCNCPSGANLHYPQHGKNLSQRTNVGLSHDRSLRFGISKLSWSVWNRTQVHCRQADSMGTDRVEAEI